jgi:threonine/homoserine/homoserine lactone efflux protein
VVTTFAVAKARTTLDPSRLRLLDGVSGGLLMLGGLALATMRRP